MSIIKRENVVENHPVTKVDDNKFIQPLQTNKHRRLLILTKVTKRAHLTCYHNYWVIKNELDKTSVRFDTYQAAVKALWEGESI